MSKNREILLRPVVSEKSINLQSKNIYTFIVDIDSNKQEVKKVVQDMFNVKVKDVRTIKVYPKKRRVRNAFSKTKVQKKAQVQLEQGYSIESLKVS
ncbi:MAG: 50S ribosomal protein L23 [Caldisericia bacterium]|jgi:large subunit ribosomal protein L23|nr:50S ribosomal protein L23 [Caldisericia bacterium]MDD3427502.1 50S ribosomal protein L23 [Caldisericia bacterium]MDD5688744.1 50S ribosomal protein L23 [Caldisericia bacterium]HOJ16092.1 50S ribosomal protein L23 [Caldisericia bacterium]HOW02795.1 50S ribosomal protein L23 [Caldisericia bacterium]